MTPNEFRDYLRQLQKSPYQWPNDYFAWKKPDGTLFMVGIRSTQMYQLIKHEMDPENWHNKIRASYGEPGEYSSVLYGISPKIGYYMNNQRYDPVEKLVDQVSGYQYVGSWRDPDLLMETRYSYSKELACGRWDLAKQHILSPERKPSLSEQIADAQKKSSPEAQKDSNPSRPQNRIEASGRE